MIMFSKYMIMFHRDVYLQIYVISNLVAFSISCLISIAGNSTTMLNRSSERGHIFLVLDFRWHSFHFPPLIDVNSPLPLELQWGFHILSLSCSDNFLVYLIIVRFLKLYQFFCQKIVMLFLYLSRWSWLIFPFISLFSFITLIGLHVLNHLQIPEISSTC
jgi:hypothetical protein